MTPQVRSLNYLRDRGWTAVTVESWKRFPDKKIPPCLVCKSRAMMSIRADLFGFGDILAFNAFNTMIVQSTVRASMSARWAKIRALPEARAWVGCDGIGTVERMLMVHGWFKKGRFWQVKEKLVMPHDFEVTKMADWQEDEDRLPF